MANNRIILEWVPAAYATPGKEVNTVINLPAMVKHGLYKREKGLKKSARKRDK